MGLNYKFSFLDDDGVFSKSREQHWTHLCTLFAILAANGLALNLEKCVFAVSELDFLGHRISAAGVAPLRDNVQLILDFPKPADCKALQRFLGMMNFYHRYLPGVAGTLCSLAAALSGNPKVLLRTPAMETTLATAKAALVATVPLANTLPGAILALAIDASDTHVGAVLQQQVGQHWQPLGFFSFLLSKTEVNYFSFDRELLAAVSGIKLFRSRLEGRSFQLWTDHKPLIFALNRVSLPTSGRKQRHLAFILEYTNQLVYVPGPSNVVADALSRPAVAATGTAGSAQPSPTSHPLI
jgi:cleavage and polyadenylation specificity factor subunit 1